VDSKIKSSNNSTVCLRAHNNKTIVNIIILLLNWRRLYLVRHKSPLSNLGWRVTFSPKTYLSFFPLYLFHKYSFLAEWDIDYISTLTISVPLKAVTYYINNWINKISYSGPLTTWFANQTEFTIQYHSIRNKKKLLIRACASPCVFVQATLHNNTLKRVHLLVFIFGCLDKFYMASWKKIGNFIVEHTSYSLCHEQYKTYVIYSYLLDNVSH